MKIADNFTHDGHLAWVHQSHPDYHLLGDDILDSPDWQLRLDVVQNILGVWDGF